jgi:hypothetical protein
MVISAEYSPSAQRQKDKMMPGLDDELRKPSGLRSATDRGRSPYRVTFAWPALPPVLHEAETVFM